MYKEIEDLEAKKQGFWKNHEERMAELNEYTSRMNETLGYSEPVSCPEQLMSKILIDIGETQRKNSEELDALLDSLKDL